MTNREHETKTFQNAPYIGFPITAYCAFLCSYCTPGGEAGPSQESVSSPDHILEVAELAYSRGTRKFRITGGEPFMHKDLGTVLFNLAKFEDAQITVNTTGIPLIDRQGILSNTPDNVSFVVSLDSLKKERLQKIRPSKIPNAYERILASIHSLAERGILKRLNMVVTQKNVDEVFDLIAFCEALGCDLKIADVAKNETQHSEMDDIYEPIDIVESQLKEAASEIKEHDYSQEFGIPCKIYRIGNVWVTVKNSKNGSRFNMDENYCGSCDEFPCHEGLYFVSALPDGTFSTCRLDKIHTDNEDLEVALDEAMGVVSGAILFGKEKE